MTQQRKTSESNVRTQCAIVRVSWDLLGELLQLPADAVVEQVFVGPTRSREAQIIVSGAGWMTSTGQHMQHAQGTITEYRSEDGIVFKRVIEWDLPNASNQGQP